MLAFPARVGRACRSDKRPPLQSSRFGGSEKEKGNLHLEQAAAWGPLGDSLMQLWEEESWPGRSRTQNTGPAPQPPESFRTWKLLSSYLQGGI